MKPLTDQMFDRAEDARDQVRALESELDAERLRCQELARMLDRVRTDYRAVAQALGSVSDTEAGTYEPAPLGVVLARITELHAAAIRETDRAFAEMRAAEVARDEALALAAEHEDACDDAVRRNRIALDNKIHWMAGMAVVHFFDLARMQALEECVRDLVRKACRAPVVPERDAATGVMSPLREVVEVGQSTTLRPGDSLDLRTGEVTRDPARKGGSVDLSMIIGDPPAAPKPEVTATFAPGWKGGDPCEILMYRPSLGSTEWIPATVVGFEAPKHIVVEVEGREARATANDIRRPPVDDRDARIADLERHAAAARTAVSESAERALATKNMRISELESRESALAETASLLGVLYPERWFNVPEYTRRAIRDRDLGVKSIADLERRLREAEATIAKVRAYCDGTIADAPAFDVARRLVAVDVLAILDGGKS
jgi:hypothetical protein